MPANPPLAASGSRELKRPRPIPRAVRAAISLMVCGKLDDPDCAPIGFIEAAALSGIKPDVMRRYLDRADVRALLRSERRVFRDAICAGNEGALRRVRDTSPNGMATVAAVRALEQIDEADPPSRSSPATPGVVINVIAAPAPAAPMVTIEARPIRVDPGPRRDENGDPVFDPRPFPYD